MMKVETCQKKKIAALEKNCRDSNFGKKSVFLHRALLRQYPGRAFAMRNRQDLVALKAGDEIHIYDDDNLQLPPVMWAVYKL